MRAYHTPPARLLALFFALAGIPLAALGWLGWRLLEQDRILEQQRLRERLENGANLVARELDRGLLAWEALLPGLARGDAVTLPPEAVGLVFDAGGVRDHRGLSLPYYPLLAASPGSENVFAVAGAQELRDGDVAAATDAYRRLASTRDPLVRAGALMRLARALRKRQRFHDALAAYNDLAAMRDATVAGSPAELVARRERIGLFQRIGDETAAEREKAALASALWEGRYRVDRATFEFFSRSAPAGLSDSAALAFARAVEEFWPLWQQQAAGRALSADKRGEMLAAVWQRTPAGAAAIVGRVQELLAASRALATELNLRVALEDPSGQVTWGDVPAGGLRVTRSLRETGLPWTIRVAAADDDAAPQVSANRGNLLAAGFTLMVLVIAGRRVRPDRRAGEPRLSGIGGPSGRFRADGIAVRTRALERAAAAASRFSSPTKSASNREP